MTKPPGGADCAPNADTTNDLFGCGTIGEAPRDSCAPLDRFSNDACYALGEPWSCPGGITQDDEALTVVKARREAECSAATTDRVRQRAL